MTAHPITPDPIRAEDLARQITETRAGSVSSALVGLWAFWFGVVAIIALLSGAELMFATSAVAALTGGLLARRAEAAVASAMLSSLGADALGGLIELLEWPVTRVRDVARWRIASLLNAMRPEDLDRLTSVQRACLLDTLNPRTAWLHPWFVEGVISILPHIADARTVPALMRLVKMRPWTKRLRRIRDAARAALPAVEEKALTLRDSAVRSAASEVSGASDTAKARTAFGAELGARPQMRFGFLLAAWVLVVPACLIWTVELIRHGHWFEAALYAVVGIGTTQLHHFTLFSKHARMVRELMNENSIEAIGRLAEAATWPDTKLRAAAVSALTRLLPQLKATDARLLTSAQRACLYSFLNPSGARTHPELVAALLSALEQVGDLAAVPHVRGLAAMSARSARLETIRDAAEQCLPALLQKAQTNTDHQTLLRPAEAPGPPDETLLRPAMPTPSSEAGLLVRPAPAPSADNHSSGETTS